MVFFTCSHCGEAVKKTKVDKHYQTVCSRKPVAVTCIDCCKDFSAETYPAHTKCISEEEKYSAKGFQPKPSGNKGEQKQLKWQEVIQSVQEIYSATLSNNERSILDAIVSHDNVPRKRHKFQNFIRSLFSNRYNANATDSIFDKIEAESKQSASNGKENKENGNLDKSTTDGDNSTADISQEEERENNSKDNPEADPPKKEEKLNRKEKKEKKKREKYEAELKEIENNKMPVDGENDDGESKKKKKKNSKEVVTENGNGGKTEENGKSEIDVTKENGMVGDDESQEKKKSKKKQKKEKKSDESNVAVEDEIKENEEKNSKKKHKKENGSLEDVPVLEDKKSKKKRKKGQDNAENDYSEEPTKKKSKETVTDDMEAEEDGDGGEVQKHPRKIKFNWQEVIIEVLKSKDEEMPLKRLKKKVLAEWEAAGGTADEKAISKFNKKVHHTPGVVVLRDVAKLVPPK